jgi:Mrp family chromosome partitioning ATPase
MSKIYEALENAEAEIKIIKKEKPSHQPRLVQRPHICKSPVARGIEGIGDLCQRVESLLPSPGGKILQFIGSRKGEGTSTIVRQFAGISALKMGKSVLVLDTDGIDPVQHVLFDVRPKYCLNEVITDGGPIERAYCQVTDPQLSVCVVSGNSISPVQVLNGSGLWEKFRIHFDHVIIDSAPLEVSSDGLAMVRKADGVILVIEAEKTRWPVVQNLRDSVIEYGGNILGAVFNKRRYHVPGWIYKRL